MGPWGRRRLRAESLHADFHTRAYLRARRRDLCPKRLQDLQLYWLSSPWEGSWRVFSVKSCLACVLAAEWVRLGLKHCLGFKTYLQIREWTRAQSKDKSTSLGVSRGLLALAIIPAAPSPSWYGTARRIKSLLTLCSVVSALQCSSDGDFIYLFIFERKWLDAYILIHRNMESSEICAVKMVYR